MKTTGELEKDSLHTAWCVRALFCLGGAAAVGPCGPCAALGRRLQHTTPVSCPLTLSRLQPGDQGREVERPQ